jgi:hypothetical protein
MKFEVLAEIIIKNYSLCYVTYRRMGIQISKEKVAVIDRVPSTFMQYVPS